MRINNRISDWKYLLRLFSEYNQDKSVSAHFTYDFKQTQLQKLADYEGLKDIISQKIDDLKKVVLIMKWVHSSLIGDGTCYPPKELHSLYILEKTKKDKLRSNCWMYAIVMNESCLAAGYYSRMVRCMPIDLEYRDCHCVTCVYIESLSKWVVFDPSNNAYYLNENMSPMSLPQVREAIILNKKIYIPLTGRKRTQDICDYWSKTLFRFECYANNKYGTEVDNQYKVIYNLNPSLFIMENYDAEDETKNCSIVNLYNELEFWQIPNFESVGGYDLNNHKL